MYSTCLFCSRDLGSNNVVETLPIGRRIAFDSDTWRLWVVCRGCEKWNLVPFNTRLETIDACEGFFHDAKLKFSTENIGIARLAEGLELVRIGRAQRPEFAAWRYGDQFGRRRKNLIAGAAVAIPVFGAAAVFSHSLPLVGVSGSLMYNAVSAAHTLYVRRRALFTVTTDDGTSGTMTHAQLGKTQFTVGDDGELSLSLSLFPRTRGSFATGLKAAFVNVNGSQVVPLLGRLLPRMNGWAGSPNGVRAAVDLLAANHTAVSLIERTPNPKPKGWVPPNAPAWLQFLFGPLPAAPQGEYFGSRVVPNRSYGLGTIPATGRLALEMLSHETTERAALAGELKLLERQWKEADAVAKIADDLVT